MKNNNRTELQALKVEQTLVHSGPLPPPAELAAFAQIDKSFPERIMRMAELEQQHSFEIGKQEAARADYIAKVNGRNATLGMLVSLVVIIVVMVAVVLCAYYRQSLPATILGGGGLAAIIATIIYGSRLKRQQ